MSFAVLFQFLCAQNVSDINISIIRSLLSETCWAQKKWNKIASDIKLVFNSSTNIVSCFRNMTGFTTAKNNEILK